VIRKYDNSDQYRSTWLTYDRGGKLHHVTSEYAGRRCIGFQNARAVA
jgi:hypothetical protein